MLIELQASEVAVGHLVIINDCDQPCGDLVAVVTSVTPGCVTARYMAKRISMKECYGPPNEVTPVNRFGCRVMLEDGKYWCEVVEQSKATYRDGTGRVWQEYGGPKICVPKPDVLSMAAVK